MQVVTAHNPYSTSNGAKNGRTVELGLHIAEPVPPASADEGEQNSYCSVGCMVGIQTGANSARFPAAMCFVSKVNAIAGLSFTSKGEIHAAKPAGETADETAAGAASVDQKAAADARVEETDESTPPPASAQLCLRSTS